MLWGSSRGLPISATSETAGASVRIVFYVGSEDPNSEPRVAGFLVQDPVYLTGRLLEDSYPKAASRMVQVEVLGFVPLFYVFFEFCVLYLLREF